LWGIAINSYLWQLRRLWWGVSGTSIRKKYLGMMIRLLFNVMIVPTYLFLIVVKQWNIFITFPQVTLFSVLILPRGRVTLCFQVNWFFMKKFAEIIPLDYFYVFKKNGNFHLIEYPYTIFVSKILLIVFCTFIFPIWFLILTGYRFPPSADIFCTTISPPTVRSIIVMVITHLYSIRLLIT